MRQHRERQATRGRAGFTLVELLVGLSLSTVVLAGVLSTFLMIGRSGMNAANYSMSDSELRRAIETFSRDVRMSKAIKWNSSSSITLTVTDKYASTSNQVTYAWDSSSSGDTAKCFYAMPGSSTSTASKTIYVRDVSNFSFLRYNRLNASASTDAETKRVQINLNVKRTGGTLVAANTALVSASYTLRNKVAN